MKLKIRNAGLRALRLSVGRRATRNDTEYLLSSPRTVARIQEARQRIARGEGIEISSAADLARLVGVEAKR